VVALPRHAALIEAAKTWAQRDDRVRALVLRGSLGRGEGDELSDVDLVIVAEPGRWDELWRSRRAVAERFGRVLGLFRELASADPTLAIAIYDGPLKVDLFFHEGALRESRRDAEGVTVPFRRDGAVPPPSRRELSRAPLQAPSGFDEHHADLDEFDAHAWDFALWLWTKLQRAET